MDNNHTLGDDAGWKREQVARRLNQIVAGPGSGFGRLPTQIGPDGKRLARLLLDAADHRPNWPGDRDLPNGYRHPDVQPAASISSVASAWGIDLDTMVQVLKHWDQRRDLRGIPPPPDLQRQNALRDRQFIPLDTLSGELGLSGEDLLNSLFEIDRLNDLQPGHFSTPGELGDALSTAPEGDAGATLERAALFLRIGYSDLLRMLLERRAWRQFCQEADEDAAAASGFLHIEPPPATMQQLYDDLDLTGLETQRALIDWWEWRRVCAEHGRIGERLWWLIGRAPDPALDPVLGLADVTLAQFAHSIACYQERNLLRDHGLGSADALWNESSKGAAGLDELAGRFGLSRRRLMEIASDSDSEARGKALAGYRWYWQATIAILVLAVLAAALLRAAYVGWNWGSVAFLAPGEVPVATRPLYAGQTLESDDVRAARVDAGESVITSKDQVPGLLLTQDIPLGRPLPKQALQRFQVVAAHDLTAGELLDSDALTLKPSTYADSAFTSLADVLGQTASQSLRSGDLILPAALRPSTPTPPLSPSVLLALPVGPGVLDSAVGAGTIASVLFVPHQGTGTALPPFSLANVVVRDVERRADGATIVIEVSPQQLQAVQPYLTGADTFVYRSTP